MTLQGVGAVLVIKPDCLTSAERDLLRQLDFETSTCSVQASLACRYLCVELEDAAFGERAAFVHGKLQAAPPAGHALDAISRQMSFMAQLRGISITLRVCPCSAHGQG